MLIFFKDFRFSSNDRPEWMNDVFMNHTVIENKRKTVGRMTKDRFVNRRTSDLHFSMTLCRKKATFIRWAEKFFFSIEEVWKKMFFYFLSKHLAASRTYGNLDLPLCETLDSIHDHQKPQLVTCQMSDQLFELMDKFVIREVKKRRSIIGCFHLI